MQKKRWIILGALVWLGACSATDVNYSDKARLSQVKQICIRDNYETRLPGLAEAFAASFEKHRIQTKVIKSMQAEAYASCQYILNGNVRARAGVINRGKFTLLAKRCRAPLSAQQHGLFAARCGKRNGFLARAARSDRPHQHYFVRQKTVKSRQRIEIYPFRPKAV